MHLEHAFHNFIAQGTMVFMIITIPNQVECFKHPYCTEKNNEHVKHNCIPFYQWSLVWHTEYGHLIRLESKIQKRYKNYVQLYKTSSLVILRRII